jgi:hypothetical protein
MMPMLLKFRLPRREKKPLTLYFPIFLVWLLLLAIGIALSPLLILIGILTWCSGYGKMFILALPMFFSVLWHLKGLMVDVESHESTFYLSFI